MPTYEYECPAGHEFELVQKMSDKPRAKCPVCGRMATRKISGGAGLVFKGSGFYITDYGKDGKGPRKPEAAEKAEGAGKTVSDKSDAAKPEKTESSSKSDSKSDTSAAKPAKSDKKKATE